MKAKKFTLLGALMACLAAPLTGCEKAAKQDPSPKVTALPYVANLYGNWRVRFFNNVDWCYNSRGNCLPEIIIHGPLYNRTALDEKFAAMTGKPDAVRRFFSGSEWSQYFPVLAAEEGAPFLQRLRSGECDLKRLDYANQSFYYAGSGEQTPSANEMVMQITYSPE